jgi:DNA-binding transcriptional ArsR family regulator
MKKSKRKLNRNELSALRHTAITAIRSAYPDASVSWISRALGLTRDAVNFHLSPRYKGLDDQDCGTPLHITFNAAAALLSDGKIREARAQLLKLTELLQNENMTLIWKRPTPSDLSLSNESSLPETPPAPPENSSPSETPPPSPTKP